MRPFCLRVLIAVAFTVAAISCLLMALDIAPPGWFYALDVASFLAPAVAFALLAAEAWCHLRADPPGP